ncbi:hypothetical protein [Geobacter anodireducens]
MENEKNLKTLKELVEARKCRKGRPDGTSAEGGYWLAIEPILLGERRHDGYDGPYWEKHYLHLRHHRNGAVRVVVVERGEGHQFGGWKEWAYESASLDHLAEARSVEEVEACLLAGVDTGGGMVAIRRQCAPGLYAALQGLGLPAALDGPDSEDAACS